MSQQVIGALIAASGILAFLFWPNVPTDVSPTPAPPIADPEKASRVEVFASLDALRDWFADQQNAKGVKACEDACHALICEETHA